MGKLEEKVLSKTERNRLRATIHGLSKTRFYYIWTCMKNRCERKTDKDYKNYGARGIKIKWKNMVEFKRDMYEPYLEHVNKFGEKNTSIDRIDNNGNYSKENCKWSTILEQSKNKRGLRKIKFMGEEMILGDWAKRFGLNLGAVQSRYYQYKWPLKKIFETPVKKYNRGNEETKGYYFHKQTGKYCAQFTVKCKTKHLGLFNTEIEAHEAYLKVLKSYVTTN